MRKQSKINYVKTKVVMDFDDGAKAEAFFRLFAENSSKDPKSLEMIAGYLPSNFAPKRIDSVKELKHNYYIKMV